MDILSLYPEQLMEPNKYHVELVTHTTGLGAKTVSESTTEDAAVNWLWGSQVNRAVPSHL